MTERHSPPTYRFSLHNRSFLSQARQTRAKYRVRLAFWLIKRQLCRLNLSARARVSLVNKQYYGCFTTFIDLHSFISLHRNDEHGMGKRRDAKRRFRSISSKRYDVHGEEGENNLGSLLPKNPKGAKRKNNGSFIIINKSPSAERKSVVPFLDFFLKCL